MQITVSDNGVFQSLQGSIGRATKRALARAAAAQELSIKHRTARGKGLNGKFKPYSAEYIEHRESKGRQTAPVNHHFTGRMLASIHWKANRNRAKLFFSSSAEKKKAARTHALRPWWGITDREQATINRIFSKELARVV